jgi:hypothetical protein
MKAVFTDRALLADDARLILGEGVSPLWPTRARGGP